MREFRKAVQEINAAPGRERVPLRERIEEFKAGAGLKGDRADRLALSAIFIEDSWLYLTEWIKRFPPGSLPALKIKTHDLAILEPLPDSDIYKIKDPEAVLNRVDEVLRVAFLQMLRNWQADFFDKMEKTSQFSKADEINVNFFKLTKVLNDNHRHQNGRGPVKVPDQIRLGLGTAVDTAINIARVVPRVFAVSHGGQAITGQEMITIMKDSKKTIVLLSSMFVNDFLNLINEVSLVGSYPRKFNWNHFALAAETVKGKNKTTVVIKPELIERIKKELAATTQVTGCPALMVKGETGKNVLEEFLDWMILILEKYYAPALDRVAAQQNLEAGV